MHVHINRFEIEGYARRAADAFINDGVELNDSITKMAQEHGFTPHHVDRVVQNANTLVNGAVVSRARDSGQDPRMSFPLADSAEIMARVNGQGDKIAGLRKTAEVMDLFTIQGQGIDREALLGGTVGGMAPSPYGDGRQSVDHMKLASDLLSDHDAGAGADAQSLSLACQTLRDLERRAVSDHAMAKNAMDQAEAGLCSEINDQLLAGTSPATVRDVVSAAGLDEKTAAYVDGLVTKVASSLRAREGQSAFVDGSVVNKDHALVTKAASVMRCVHEAVHVHRGLDKIASSHRAARAAYAQAVSEAG